MSAAAPADPVDAIVVLELSLNNHHQVPDVVACLRAGALAWLNAPARGIDAAFRAADVDKVLAVAQELEDEARRVHAAREAFYKAQAKEERRGRSK